MTLRPPHLRGLRARTLLLLGLTFAPVVALALYVVAHSARRERALAFQSVHRWASIVSANQQDLISATHLSRRLFSHAAGAGAEVRDCPDIARAVVRSPSRYANIGLIELDGTVSCSAVPTGGVTLADRAYFRQARNRRSFAYGRFQIGPVDFAPFTESVRQLGWYWLVLNQPAPQAKRHE